MRTIGELYTGGAGVVAQPAEVDAAAFEQERLAGLERVGEHGADVGLGDGRALVDPAAHEVALVGGPGQLNLRGVVVRVARQVVLEQRVVDCHGRFSFRFLRLSLNAYFSSFDSPPSLFRLTMRKCKRALPISIFRLPSVRSSFPQDTE